MKYFLLLFTLLCSCSCLDLKYKDDKGLISAAAANSLEFNVTIGKTLCKDMDGIIGICSKRIKNDAAIEFTHPALPYAYQFFLTCSPEIESDFNKYIPSNTAYSFKILPEKYNGMGSFICIGKIVPDDRNLVDTKWEVRVKVMDSKYIPREDIYVFDKYLVLGKYARYAKVYHDKKWHTYHKRSYVRVKNTTNIKAMSESYLMRYNYYNWE